MHILFNKFKRITKQFLFPPSLPKIKELSTCTSATPAMFILV